VGREAIYVADADGSNARAIYGSQQSPESLTDVRWSPDGASIGFILTSRPPGGGSEADWRYQLMVMGADGSDPHPTSDEKITSFSWSPDGNRIAYTAESVDGTRLIDDISTMSVDGSDRRQLTSDGVSGSPMWSPDGALIAFRQRSGVAVMRVDGTSVRQVSAGDGFDALGALDWSPDSSRLLVDGVRSGDCSLMAIGLDGAVSTLLRGPIPMGPSSGDSGSSSTDPCVDSAAWSVGSETMSPSADAGPLLGSDLAESLGLTMQDHFPPTGCQFYVEVDNPKGYCLDSVAGSKVDHWVLAQKLQGHVPTAAQIECFSISDKLGNWEGPTDSREYRELQQRFMECRLFPTGSESTSP